MLESQFDRPNVQLAQRLLSICICVTLVQSCDIEETSCWWQFYLKEANLTIYKNEKQHQLCGKWNQWLFLAPRHNMTTQHILLFHCIWFQNLGNTIYEIITIPSLTTKCPNNDDMLNATLLHSSFFTLECDEIETVFDMVIIHPCSSNIIHKEEKSNYSGIWNVCWSAQIKMIT